MFEALFKFDRIQFAEGSLGLQDGGGVLLFSGCALVLAAALVLVYRSTDRFASPRDRGISFGLRTAALLILCLPLLEPVLIMPDVVPDENFVAVVVDASESMNVPDGRDGRTRQEDARVLLVDGDDALVSSLSEHFKLRYYTFGDHARRVDSLTAGSAEEHGTNISTALDRVLSDFGGLPLAGVVLLTDGGDNSSDVPLNKAEELRARGVPLHIVGIGRESAGRDRELLEATVNRGVEVTTGAEIDVKARSWGEEPEPVSVDLYRDEELVHTSSHRLKGDGLIDQFTVFYEPDGPDAREYVLRIEEDARERNTANNELRLLIDPRQDTLKVLFIEGHPRQDFKFIKRSLEDDQAVHFTSILRTGTGKYYRQGIRSEDELLGGFPGSEEELFDFRAVLFGDVEATHFSIEQLNVLEQFVKLRGGGFAMLGGRVSFAEGAYWDNPIADVLPVVVDPDRRSVVPAAFRDEDTPPDERGFTFRPTEAGLQSPILRLSADPSENRTRWMQMPGLTSINYLGPVKPGAVVLAEKPEDEHGGPEPILIVQRYGKGRSAALATASTWRWQMLLGVEDQQHERFWRQFVRWLAASAPSRVDLDLENQRFARDEEIEVSVNVYDERYRPQEGSAVIGTLTDPFGTVRDVTFRPDLGEPGAYSTTLLPTDDGVYELDVSAEAEGVEIGTKARSLLVRPTRKEYYDAVLKKPFLEHLAEAAGGIYYDPNDVEDLSLNLRARRTSTSVFRVEYLWDMPFLFGLVLVLLSAEWIWRRRKGLP